MEILITSILAFVSTNIDDIFILTLFYGSKKFKGREIIAGQYLGIISLIVISLMGSLAGLLINQAYIGLLGFVPIYLGVKGIWGLIKNKKEDDHPDNRKEDKARNNTLAVATVTFANGGDNLGIYTPLFAALTWSGRITMITVFLSMTFLWCLLARYFTKHPYVAKAVDKYGHIVAPIVLIFLGFYILYESEVLGLLAK